MRVQSAEYGAVRRAQRLYQGHACAGLRVDAIAVIAAVHHDYDAQRLGDGPRRKCSHGARVIDHDMKALEPVGVGLGLGLGLEPG